MIFRHLHMQSYVPLPRASTRPKIFRISESVLSGGQAIHFLLSFSHSPPDSAAYHGTKKYLDTQIGFSKHRCYISNNKYELHCCSTPMLGTHFGHVRSPALALFPRLVTNLFAYGLIIFDLLCQFNCARSSSNWEEEDDYGNRSTLLMQPSLAGIWKNHVRYLVIQQGEES